jgi:hypothetical protein
MANRKKRGRSKVGEVAAPTNEVTTSVEARGVPLTDTEPPKKKGGRSKGKVGSENEPVETAPGDGELNISEEGLLRQLQPQFCKKSPTVLRWGEFLQLIPL